MINVSEENVNIPCFSNELYVKPSIKNINKKIKNTIINNHDEIIKKYNKENDEDPLEEENVNTVELADVNVNKNIDSENKNILTTDDKEIKDLDLSIVQLKEPEDDLTPENNLLETKEKNNEIKESNVGQNLSVSGMLLSINRELPTKNSRTNLYGSRSRSSIASGKSSFCIDRRRSSTTDGNCSSRRVSYISGGDIEEEEEEEDKEELKKIINIEKRELNDIIHDYEKQKSNEPKIMSVNKKVKLVFSDEVTTSRKSYNSFYEEYLDKSNKIEKDSYYSDYKNELDKKLKETKKLKKGLSIYKGAKTFLSPFQIDKLEKIQKNEYENHNEKSVSNSISLCDELNSRDSIKNSLILNTLGSKNNIDTCGNENIKKTNLKRKDSETKQQNKKLGSKKYLDILSDENINV